MNERISVPKVSPAAYKAMRGLEAYIAESGLERKLYELIKIRASQINGCAYCLNMHTRDARKLGETEQRLYLVGVWRETSLFTPQEKAALALTEAMTLIADKQHVPDEIYDEAARHFNEKGMAALIMAVVAINGWNRIAITSQTPPEDW